MMDIKIFQIDHERDINNVKFMSLDRIEKYQGSPDVDSNIYNKVWEGSVNAENLEDVYCIFNEEHPEDYTGHSLSVSDVVEIVRAPEIVGRIDHLSTCKSYTYTDFVEYTLAQDILREHDIDFEAHDYVGLHVPVIEKGFYFCDSFGFKHIEFEPEKIRKHESVEENKRISLWARVGVSLEVTPEQLEVLKSDSSNARALLIDLIRSDKATICGETYFPEPANEEYLVDDLNFDGIYDVPLQAYSQETPDNKLDISLSTLDSIISNASSRANNQAAESKPEKDKEI